MLLFLVQLVDQLVLDGHFVIEALDGVVLGVLLLLSSLNCHLEVSNVLLHVPSLILKGFLHTKKTLIKRNQMIKC